MAQSDRPAFRGGRNIAIKIPPAEFAATVAFYRDVLKLEDLGPIGKSEAFAFGAIRLWLDPMPTLSQAEVWLEVVSDDMAAAERHLAAAGVVRCDEIEQLPDGFKGFWIASPAGIVHLIAHPSEDPEPTRPQAS